MSYRLAKQIRNDKVLRESFLKLAINTFELSFENWYQQGHWTDKYIPYCLVEDETVVACAAVNQMEIVFEGTTKNYIQIGTVMTEESHRNQGLSRRLIDEIIHDFSTKVEGIYLFANETVLDFYPKFGFIEKDEYQISVSIEPVVGDFVKLDMGQASNKELLKNLYQQNNPFSKLRSINNYDLLMFYCDNFMRDCVYYSAKRRLAVVAIQNKTHLECFDIFGETELTLKQVLNEVASSTTETVNLGFSTPKTLDMVSNKIYSDEQLFVSESMQQLFVDNQIMFPLLSHA